MRRQDGLGLIEILIAAVIMVVGIFAVIALQASALGHSNKVRALQKVLSYAQTELALQKNTLIALSSNPSCLTNFEADYLCTVSILPCQLASNTINCATGLSQPVAFQVKVILKGPQDTQAELKTLVSQEANK